MSISEHIYFVAIILDFDINIIAYSEHGLFSFLSILLLWKHFLFLFMSVKSEMYMFEEVIYKRF